MESDSELDHRADSRTAGNQQASGRRTVNPGDQLQQGALARTVPADQPDRVPPLNTQGYTLQRPELLDPLAVAPMQEPQKPDLQLARCVMAEKEAFRHRLHVDHRH